MNTQDNKTPENKEKQKTQISTPMSRDIGRVTVNEANKKNGTNHQVVRTGKDKDAEGHDVPNATKTKKSKTSLKKHALIGFSLIIVAISSISVLLIIQKQKEPGTKAPTAPESRPEADIGLSGCTVTFNVKANASITPSPSPTPTGTTTPTPTPTVTPSPTPTPEPETCGYTPCIDNNDCVGDLICIETTADHDQDGSYDKYCSMMQYIDACQAEPNYATCCTEPTPTVNPSPTVTPSPTPSPTPTGTPMPTSTPTPTPTPTATPTHPPVPTTPPAPNGPQTYVVETNTGCNSPCTVNADCDNLSHICYNGRCRLDVNPEDEFCRLPSGGTTVERIVEQPVSGPEDWGNWIKLSIGGIALGLLGFLAIF